MFEQMAKQMEIDQGEPIKPPEGPVEDCGILILENKAYKFVADRDFIYANGKAIIHCQNDRWTAMSVFMAMMYAFYGDKYTESTTD